MLVCFDASFKRMRKGCIYVVCVPLTVDEATGLSTEIGPIGPPNRRAGEVA
jgi:hypothetical protein